MSDELTDKKDESLTISIWGLKISCSNPSRRTTVIIVIVLIFLIFLVFKLGAYLLPLAGISKGKNFIFQLFKKV